MSRASGIGQSSFRKWQSGPLVRWHASGQGPAEQGEQHMSVREWMGNNQKATSVGAGALTVLAIGLIIYQLLPERQSTKAWYTTNDGKTWFKDSNRKVPPFDYGGKQAVLAKVYECNGKQ